MPKEFERHPIEIHSNNCYRNCYRNKHAIIVIIFNPIEYIIKIKLTYL